MTTKPKAKILHRTKLFGGTKTAEEIYQEIAVNRPCGGCGAPGLTKFATLVMLKDLREKAPAVLAAIMSRMEPGAAAPVTKTVYGPMVCVGQMVACKACTPTAERAASKGEREWSKKGITVHIEINRGPGVDIPIFQVGGGTPSDPA